MILTLNHKKMDVWIKSKELVKEVYKLCSFIPADEKYIIIPQIKRSALSVLSNISEGYSRHSEKELKRFLEISRSSLVELDTQIEVALELEIINIKQIVEISKLITDIFSMLSGLLRK